MSISPFCKPLGITAAIISLVQGLIWIVLSILAILIHTNLWTPSFSEISYGQLLSKEIVTRYLNGNSISSALNVNLLMEPKEFFIWIILYLVLSVFWVTIASIVLVIIFEKKVNLIKTWYLILGVCISIICACDLVLGSLFASDYNTITGRMNSDPNEIVEYSMAVSACGIVMTIVSRGFTLWIVNLFFSVFMIKLSFGIPSKVSSKDHEAFIDAFGASPALKDNNTFGLFNGLPRLPPIQSTNERLTNLNKITTNSATGTPEEFTNNLYLYSLQQQDESDFDANSVDSFAIDPPLKSALRNRY